MIDDLEADAEAMLEAKLDDVDSTDVIALE